MLIVKARRGHAPGTRLAYPKKNPKYWMRKLDTGEWVYDGQIETKRAPKVGERSEVVAAEKQRLGAGLTAMSKDQLSKLQAETTKRDRISEGQLVQYNGKGSPQHTGQMGTLIAMGDYGAAQVKMRDGSIIAAKWGSLTPQGQIKPHSLYDDLESRNVMNVSGKMADNVAKVMETKIGRSGFSYKTLAQEFKRRGFTLLIVGGTVRDFLAGTAVNDVDFIFDGTDGELKNVIAEMHKPWARGWVTNSHLGLVSFTDGNETVDITPVHKYSAEMRTFVKGWKLKDDAEARDLTMNTLQLDPLRGVLVDGTGKGLKSIRENTIEFSDPTTLSVNPAYVLRALKFIARGYGTSGTTDEQIRDGMQHVRRNLSPMKKEKFLRRQVGEKDGVDGLRKFEKAFKRYDAALWRDQFAEPFKKVMREMGGSSRSAA